MSTLLGNADSVPPNVSMYTLSCFVLHVIPGAYEGEEPSDYVSDVIGKVH